MKQKNLKNYLIIALLISFAISILIHFPAYFDRIAYDEENQLTSKGIFDFIFELTITTLVAFLMFLMNYFILKPFQKQANTRSFDILPATILTLVLVFFLNHSFFAIKRLLVPDDGQNHFRTHYTFQNMVVGTAVLICVIIIRLIFQKQRIELENERLKTESLQSQFDSLKNQVSPHFLFNSLNALQTLIREDADIAQKYVRHLSLVLRYTLQSNENKTVTLNEELSFLDSYIFLIQLRFGTNFKIEMIIKDEFATFRIPPLSLQTLVENAVKHNEISKKKPLTILIETTTDQNMVVSNRIQEKINPDSGTSIGLANLAKQYQLLANKMITIKKTNNKFTVIIPLLKPDIE
ncbi:MAG: histidine kinase [Mariniphaga sp.]